MDKTKLGDRIKSYEKTYCGQRAIPMIPTIARIDGKAFHTWTKGLNKPFDLDFVRIMQETTKRLVEYSDASIGYTQSDEISLLFYSDNTASQIFFDGKLHKLTSVLASACTAFFSEELSSQANLLGLMREHDRKKLLLSKKSALFDCRVFQVPTKQEAVNYFIWREQDAVRNSIQSVGQAYFSHNLLHRKSCDEIQDMLFQEKDINWNDFDPMYKKGTYYGRRNCIRQFTTEELEALPPMHEARLNPDLEIKRTDIVELDLPILTKIKNREEVIFDGAEYEEN